MADLTIYSRIEEEHISLLSDIMITPRMDIYEYSLNHIINLLKQDSRIFNVELTEDMSVEFERFKGIIEFEDRRYYVEIVLDKFEDDNYYQFINDMAEIHNINQNDIEAIHKANGNIVLLMEFDENPRRSYLDQLYLLNLLTNNEAILAYDNSASKPLSMNLLKMLLSSQTLPAYSLLYSIQNIHDSKTNTVWLHSHGLNRCGMVELEILNISEGLNEFFSILTATIDRYLEKGMPKRGETVMVAQLPNQYLEIAWLPWQTALESLNQKKGLFKKAPQFIGNTSDRLDHDHPSGVLYVNVNGTLSPMNTITKIIQGNLMVMISDEETLRMSQYAKERLKEFRFVYQHHQKDPDYYCLIKAGIDIEGENIIGSEHEHMWFEVKELNDDDFVGVLINDPYNVASMKKDETYTISLDKLTEYRIYRKDKVALDPENIYIYYDEILCN